MTTLSEYQKAKPRQPFNEWSQRKRVLAAFFCGVCATLALPPFFVLPLLAVSVCGWFILANAAETRRQAMAIGWFWGLGFFMSGLYWMCISLLVDAEKFAWLIPFCFIGLNGIIAIYPALATGIFWTLSRRFSLPLLQASLLFITCWSISEFARSILFTGFPWNLVGYAWGISLPAMQSASVFGIHGLTLLTMLLAICPLWFKSHHKYFMSVVGIWVALFVWGAVHVPPETQNTKTNLRVVQAAIPQSLKWNPTSRMSGIQKHAKLSQKKFEITPNIIIWPESAVPFALNKEPRLVSDLSSLVPEDRLLITGALRIENQRYYNSIYALNSTGVVASYDKRHLVPFGEFVPFRNILPLSKITPGDTDFSKGEGPVNMELKGFAPFTPLICYEAIFPVHHNQASWMLNITNDAWFGNSTGPYQHFQMTRFRAVEEGLPLIRAANTGISAVIDPYGRVVDSLKLNEFGVLDAPLPAAVAETTLFSKFGNALYLVILFILAVLAFIRRKHV